MILISDLFSDEYMERLQRPGSGLEHGEVSDGPIACPLCTKTFTLYSDGGSTRTIDCENSDQFMSIFLLIRDKLEEEQIEYSGVSVRED